MHTRTTAISRWKPLPAVVLALAAAGPARAEPGACQMPAQEGSLFLQRDAIISRYEQLPESCLKAMFRHCSRAASQDFLDGGTAAHCSMGYEALLRRSFGGNFNALLAWWRSERAGER